MVSINNKSFKLNILFKGMLFLIKNEIKNMIELTQITKDNPFESFEVNIQKPERKSKSP